MRPYRKRQLAVFERLLGDAQYFEYLSPTEGDHA